MSAESREQRTGAGAAASARPCRISPHRDGPLIVRGPFRLLGADGGEIEPRRRTVALCRCGRSRIAPFCDGTHKVIGFAAGAGAGRAPREG